MAALALGVLDAAAGRGGRGALCAWVTGPRAARSCWRCRLLCRCGRRAPPAAQSDRLAADRRRAGVRRRECRRVLRAALLREGYHGLPLGSLRGLPGAGLGRCSLCCCRGRSCCSRTAGCPRLGCAARLAAGLVIGAALVASILAQDVPALFARQIHVDSSGESTALDQSAHGVAATLCDVLLILYVAFCCRGGDPPGARLPPLERGASPAAQMADERGRDRDRSA